MSYIRKSGTRAIPCPKAVTNLFPEQYIRASEAGLPARCSVHRLQSSRSGDSSPQSEALGVRDTVAREVRRLQEAHAEGTGPAVDRQTIIALIRKVQAPLRTSSRATLQPAVPWADRLCPLA